MKTILNLTILVLIISSCSVEKRMHQPGYFIQWNKNYTSSSENSVTKNNIEDQNQENLQESYLPQEIITNSIQSDEVSEPSKNDLRVENKKHSVNASTVNLKKENLQENKLLNAVTEIAGLKSIKTRANSIKNKHVRADNELIINIVLTVLFAAATVIFIFLALAAIAPMIYVWWGLALVAAILLITQVIDLIMW